MDSDIRSASSSKTVCDRCHHNCRLKEGQSGICNTRMARDGELVPLNYGRFTSLALDPIEKKPLYHFYPGTFILSVGSFGCNLKCPFCQNHAISQADASIDTHYFNVEELVDIAVQMSLRPQGNLGIAFTYNEPLMNYEFILDTAPLLKQHNLKTVIITSGSLAPKYFKEVCSVTEAMNIDLKGFSQRVYAKLKGDFRTVCDNIKTAVAAGVHVEVTTLLVPGINDSIDEFRQETDFLSSISPDLPLHITRYFPRYRYTEEAPTSMELLNKFYEAAAEKLRFVHIGNV